LWAILSILWIAGVGAIVIMDTGLLEANKTFEVEGRNKEKYEVIAPSRATESEVVAFAKRNQRTDCTEDKTGPWCDFPVKLQMPHRAIDSFAIYIALGIPATTFLIGGGLYWAFLGFKRTT
jgi:hypothetical protein